jgi:uncharacterized protein YbjT (DUF2867 family)
MRILVVGASGFVGSRLVERLLNAGHQVVGLVRDASRAPPGIELLIGDLLDPPPFPEVDAAYYLVHSMRQSARDFERLEACCAEQFVSRIGKTGARQVIYLSGLSGENQKSRHFASRQRVEQILQEGPIPVTVLRASIILGEGSASLQIIRDLIEKLPVMVAPRWVNQLTQPIAIDNVLDYLVGVLGHPACIGRTFEIGGDEVLSYKQLLLRYAQIHGFKRWIITMPVLTPRISAYWLVFVTSASLSLARSLIESVRADSICREHSIRTILPLHLIPIDEALIIASRQQSASSH